MENKKILKIIVILIGSLLLALNLFAQTPEPIVGTWKFALDHKINRDALTDTLVARGIPRDSTMMHVTFSTNFMAIVIARCGYSEIVFSDMGNQVMITTHKFDDILDQNIEWGKWYKLSEERYMVEFKNRLEFYVLNEETGEFHYRKAPNDDGFVGAMLNDNLKIVKKKD